MRRIATTIEQSPELLTIALENLDRWETLGRVHPGPIRDWRRRIVEAQESPQAFQNLIVFLATPNHDSEPIKSCSPFVGLPLSVPPSFRDPA